MPFIGTQPEVGGYSVLDALTASATASYTLQKDSANFVPNSANQLLVSLNGVIQKPGSSFTISGSTLTFSSALTSSDSIDFILAMGEPLLVGTPSDGTVSTAKIATDAVTSAKLASTLDLSGTGRTGHGGLKSVQVFTSSGTYTKPTGISTVKVICTGGGGGGAEGKSTFNYGGGGAAGGTAIDIIDVSSTSSVTVTIGAGGAAQTTGNGSAGNNGATSSFGSFCSATGGEGGKAEGGGQSRAAPGNGTGGVINILGGQGGSQGGGNTSDEAAAGMGGSSFWGGGGTHSATNRDDQTGLQGQTGRAFGSGGGGGRHHSNGVFGNGGAGKEGVVYVEEYA